MNEEEKLCGALSDACNEFWNWFVDKGIRKKITLSY